MQNTCEYFFDNVRSVHWGMNAPPPSKTPPLFLAKPPPYIYKPSKSPRLGNSPLSIGFS